MPANPNHGWMPTVKIEDEELWKQAKISAIKAGQDVKDWFADAVKLKLANEKNVPQRK